VLEGAREAHAGALAGRLKLVRRASAEGLATPGALLGGGAMLHTGREHSGRQARDDATLPSDEETSSDPIGMVTPPWQAQ
jgi:hypothetical protein